MTRIRVGMFSMVMVFLFALPQSAQAAYIDPNTGGMLFQILAVVFGFFSAAVLLFSSRIRMTAARFKRLIRNLIKNRRSAETTSIESSRD